MWPPGRYDLIQCQLSEGQLGTDFAASSPWPSAESPQVPVSRSPLSQEPDWNFETELKYIIARFLHYDWSSLTLLHAPRLWTSSGSSGQATKAANSSGSSCSHSEDKIVLRRSRADYAREKAHCEIHFNPRRARSPADFSFVFCQKFWERF